RLRRVSRREPCPICSRTEWCEVRDDGAVHCMRVESPVPGTSRGGGWWHTLHDRSARPTTAPPAPNLTPPSPSVPRADVTTLDAVYRRMLELCLLSDQHRRYLQTCGLPDHELSGAYGTLASLHGPILAGLQQQFSREILFTVPGIYRKDDGGLALSL